MESIVIIGKFDQNMLLLEEQIMNIESGLIKHSINYSPEIAPDIVSIKYAKYDCCVWPFVGDVKPPLFLKMKDKIPNIKIIIFTFNSSNPESLEFLNEEWESIINKIDKKYQKRFLVGTTTEQTNSNLFSDEQIEKTIKKFGCDDYFIENVIYKSNSNDSKIINYIKSYLHENCSLKKESSIEFYKIEQKTSKKTSILFVGKYDKNLCSLEEKIINVDQEITKYPIKYSEDEVPDVVKYEIDDYKSNVFVLKGNIKPSTTFQYLIPKMEIIIFVFNLENPDSLNLLIKGWLPIIDTIDEEKIKNQKRILVGTQKNDYENLNESFCQIIQNSECNNFNELIDQIQNKWNCEKFFKIRSDKSSELIEYIKKLIIHTKMKNENFHQKIDIANKNSADLTENNEMSITYYLQFKLFDGQNQILKIIINDKSKMTESLTKFSTHFIKQKNENILYYTIYKNESYYTVEYYNIETSAQNLPSIMSVQMNPSSKSNPSYRVFVVCNKEQIKDDFKLNENCFSIAIGINSNDSTEKLKQKVINYLQIKYSINSNDPVIYVFKNNEFQIFKGIKQTPDEFKRTPLFISFKRDEFQLIQQHIQDHMIIQQQNEILSNLIEDPIIINKKKEEDACEMNKRKNSSINYSINNGENSNFQKQNKNIQNPIENSSIVENEAIKEDLHEDFREIEDIESKHDIDYTDTNHVIYKLHVKSHSANIIKVSPKTPSDIFIPEFIKYGGNEYIVTKICDNAFSQSKIEKLSFAETSKLYSIGDFAFKESTLTHLIIPSNLNKISEFCFIGADNLTDIDVDKNNRYFYTEKMFLYFNKDAVNSNYSINPQKNNIKIFALKDFLYNNQSKSDILIKFTKRQSLLSYKSSSQIQQSVSFDLNKCQNIQNIQIKSKKVEISKDFYKDSIYIESVDIDCEELIIGDGCFANCSNLSSITFNNLKKAIIGVKSFNGSMLKNIEINYTNRLELKPQCFSGNKNIETIKIAGNEIIINDNCFMNCSSLMSISISKSNSIKIGNNAFTQCSSIKDVQISVLKSIEIGKYCFCRADKLEKIQIYGVKKLKISEGCFENCKLLSKVSFPDVNDITFSQYSFKGCEKINRFIMQKDASASFEKHCFEGIHNLSSIELNCSEMVIDENCFENNFSFNDKILNNVKVLTIHQFDSEFLNKFSGLEKVIIDCNEEIQIKPHTLDTIGSLTQIELKAPSIIIEKSNFTNNKKLESIEFESEIIIIKEDCFNNTTKLDILIVNSQQIQIHSECFKDSNLHTILLEGEILIIGNKCFQNCKNLKQISMKNINYVELGKESFIGCNRLNVFDITPMKNSINKYFKPVQYFGQSRLTYKVVEIATNKLFYSKTIKTIRNKKDDLSNFFNNMIELTKLDNQFVLPIKGFSFLSFNKEPFPMIFTKNIQGHTLEDYINKDNLPISKKYIILIFITIGMQYLHSKNIVHTNLKPPSIIIDENLYPHINEYFIPSIKKTHYTAPEIFENNRYSTKSDIYSFSIIAYILLTGHSPFRNCEIYELSKSIQNKKEELSFEHISDSNIKQFFEQCTSIIPSNRLPFDIICKELIKPQYVELFKLNHLDINAALKSYGIQIEYKIKHVETPDQSENINIDLYQQNSQPIIDSNANISSNNLDNDTITIVRYLKNKLFNEQYNLNIVKIEIKNKSKCSLEFNDIKSEILSDDSLKALFYSINPNKNYKIELYNEHTKIQQLPAFLSVQYNPKKHGEYRIFVVCNIEQIKNNFKLNENCFSIAIDTNLRDKPEILKQKVINYLQINYSISSNDTVIYVFENNGFQNFEEIKQIPDEKTPLFISFKQDKFQQIQKHIQKHMTVQQRTFSESVNIIYTRYLKNKLFTINEKLLVVKIEDSSRIKKKLKDHLSRFIKSKSSDFLYYTINKESNYKVEYFNYETSTHLLPSVMSIQMYPYSITNPFYCIFVICNIEQIQNDFKLNENCFSIAIDTNLKDKPEILKQKVINYLQINYSISSNDTVIYVFENNGFQNFEEIKQIPDEKTPLFISFKQDKFQQIQKHIQNHSWNYKNSI